MGRHLARAHVLGKVSRLKSGGQRRAPKLGAGAEEVGDSDDYYGAERGGGQAIEKTIGAAYDAESGEDPASDYAAD